MRSEYVRPDDCALEGYVDTPWRDVAATAMLMVWGYGMVLLMGVVA